MRKTVWALIAVVVMQLVAGNAWSWPGTSDAHSRTHCHEPAVYEDVSAQLGAQASGHPCCAVGLGTGVQWLLGTVAHLVPSSPLSGWLSWQVPPDLRPPI